MNGKLTPLMQQYWEIKSQHEDKILLFRMGDFYEMFFDDAVKAAPILDIALTSRNKSQGIDVPMCGVPHHSIAGPINKLLRAGLKVAICDQVEDPAQAKGIVKRAVTRVVTPGVIYDPDELEATASIFVACVVFGWEISLVDTTTGACFFACDLNESQVQFLLDQYRPKELLLDPEIKPSFVFSSELMVTRLDAVQNKEAKNSREIIRDYVLSLQGNELAKTLKSFEEIKLDGLKLSTTTIRHLEIFETSQREKKGSLFWAVDRTLTPMGGRRQRSLLGNPSGDLKTIQERLDAVQWFFERAELRVDIRRLLRNLGDLERKIAKLSNPLCNARDLSALAASLQTILEIRDLVLPASQGEAQYHLGGSEKIIQRIKANLRDELPVSVREGGMIREGVSSELDEYIRLATHAQQALAELEARERGASGIQSLKVKFNNIFGYSIEVTHANRSKVPAHFIRKQTLANAERYITEELTALEQKILSAEQKRREMEYRYFNELRLWALDRSQALFKIAYSIASLDVHQGLAELAFERGYVRPEILAFTESLELTASRHPVIEQLGLEKFIPNDIVLGRGECILLTGPNMAGKSTLMRQVALTVLLAHCGSFVPASQAKLPLMDQIFTRIGASDHLTAGLSTFMVEMVETAQIVSQATGNSLVILDEIGRGTSTFDGMSLAQAILEHFSQNTGSWTFFATHYQELTGLESKWPTIKNFHMAIREYKGSLVFLRKLTRGAASKSYGIQVAKQAGLPVSITERAHQVLREIELQSKAVVQDQLPLFAGAMVAAADGGDARRSAFVDELKGLQIDGLTPLEALNKLSQWQRTLS